MISPKSLAEALLVETLCETCNWNDDESLICPLSKRANQPVKDCEEYEEDLSECSQGR